jgi:hypothetical protein
VAERLKHSFAGITVEAHAVSSLQADLSRFPRLPQRPDGTIGIPVPASPSEFVLKPGMKQGLIPWLPPNTPSSVLTEPERLRHASNKKRGRTIATMQPPPPGSGTDASKALPPALSRQSSTLRASGSLAATLQKLTPPAKRERSRGAGASVARMQPPSWPLKRFILEAPPRSRDDDGDDAPPPLRARGAGADDVFSFMQVRIVSGSPHSCNAL